MKKISLKKYNIFDVIALIFGIMVLFMQPLKNMFHAFSYIDEILILLALIIFILVTFIKKKINKEDINILYLFLIFIFIGFLGNIINKLNIPYRSILVDIFSFSKFIVFTICGIRFFECTNCNDRLIKVFSNIVKINIIIALPLAILNQFSNFGMRDDYRYGIYCFKYIYDSAAIFSWYCLMFLLVLSIYNIQRKTRSNNLFIFLNLLLWIFTGRSRAFAFCIIYILLMILKRYFQNGKKKIKFKPLYLIIPVLIGMIVAKNQIVFYFTTTSEPRYLLLHYGLFLCKKYFPLGAGLGTFGTFAAQKFYSPLYYQLGLNRVWGFTANNPLYLTDNFWPAVLGETGVIGFIIYLILIYKVFKYIYMKIAINNESKIIIIYFIITILCSSIATAIFTQNATIGDLFFISMIPGILKLKDNKDVIK